MNRKPGKGRQVLQVLLGAIVLLVAQQSARSQQEQEAMGLCFTRGNTAVVQSTIGGEAHDSYLFHASAGRRVTVNMTSPRNRAQFTVSTSEFGEPVSFGKETRGGRTWTGTIPQTGVYFISVVAHPTARYTLKVTKH